MYHIPANPRAFEIQYQSLDKGSRMEKFVYTGKALQAGKGGRSPDRLSLDNKTGEKGIRMKQGHNRLIVIMAIIAGFLGGMLSNQLFQAKEAYAEKENREHKVIVAQEFRVVDKLGKTIGSFGIPPRLGDFIAYKSAYSEEKHLIATLKLMDDKGNVLWSAP